MVALTPAARRRIPAGKFAVHKTMSKSAAKKYPAKYRRPASGDKEEVLMFPMNDPAHVLAASRLAGRKSKLTTSKQRKNVKKKADNKLANQNKQKEMSKNIGNLRNGRGGY